ncbi:MAG: murB [Anaerophaga sp.]|nr:murB [Anaerophaga sp.]
MDYYTDYPLEEYTTFGVAAQAARFFRFDTEDELKKWIRDESPNHPEKLVLGGGSNLLFTGNFDGTVLYPAFKGIEITREEGDSVLVRMAAGEAWDRCVEWCVEKGLGGIENLSFIPGHAGAAAVQNIGAYGVELSDVLAEAHGYYLDSGEAFSLDCGDCDYDYRYSIFKGPLKNKAVITSVVLRLSRVPRFNLSYGQVQEAVKKRGTINLRNIRNAIIDIRKEKLPDPAVFGNGGSFFKNPVVDRADFERLKHTHPGIVGYPLENNKVKIAAGWLIEKAGWKGRSSGKAAVHEKQALVLINKGGASGKEIARLAYEIQSDIRQKFGIMLEPEVNII